MRQFFFYGSLMSPNVLGAVTGYGKQCESWESCKAKLRDFRIFTVLGELYPGIVKDVGNHVDGIMVTVPLEAADTVVARLDLFEGVHDVILEL